MGLGALGVAGAAAAASVGGSLIQANAAQTAAGQESAAYQQAAQYQEQTQQQNAARLSPYVNAGDANLPAYQNYYQTTQAALAPSLANAQAQLPQSMTQAQLVQYSPGYQFSLAQGLKAVQSSNAAQGLGVSGSAMKGAANFATGLANNTYSQQLSNQNLIYNAAANQFGLANTAQNSIFNQLASPVSMGENAAATIGNQGVQSSQLVGQNLGAVGVAQAAGTTGAASAYSNALNSLGNAPANYLGASNYLATQAALQNSLGAGSFNGDINGNNGPGGNIG